MRINWQQLTSKAFPLLKFYSTRLCVGIAEMGNTPLSTGTPTSAHTEVGDAEWRGVYPLHNNHARLAVANNHSATFPFD